MMQRSVNRLLYRARRLEYEDRLDEAGRIVDRILAHDPMQGEGRMIQARIHARIGRTECARQELGLLLQGDGENLEARLTLAGVLLLTGRYNEAIDHLAEAARQCREEAEPAERFATAFPPPPGFPAQERAARWTRPE